MIQEKNGNQVASWPIIDTSELETNYVSLTVAVKGGWEPWSCTTRAVEAYL